MDDSTARVNGAVPIDYDFLSMRLASSFVERYALPLTLCWVLALALTGSTDVFLFLAPALLIAVPLLAGRYVGEKLIARLLAERAPKSRRVTKFPAFVPRTSAICYPRGTRLLALSLAKRPPPTGFARI